MLPGKSYLKVNNLEFAMFIVSLTIFTACTRMDDLPAAGFTVYNLVHKLARGSGGPTRVIAVVGRGAPNSASTQFRPCHLVISTVLLYMALSSISFHGYVLYFVVVFC